MKNMIARVKLAIVGLLIAATPLGLLAQVNGNQQLSSRRTNAPDNGTGDVAAPPADTRLADALAKGQQFKLVAAQFDKLSIKKGSARIALAGGITGFTAYCHPLRDSMQAGTSATPIYTIIAYAGENTTTRLTETISSDAAAAVAVAKALGLEVALYHETADFNKTFGPQIAAFIGNLQTTTGESKINIILARTDDPARAAIAHSTVIGAPTNRVAYTSITGSLTASGAGFSPAIPFSSALTSTASQGHFGTFAIPASIIAPNASPRPVLTGATAVIGTASGFGAQSITSTGGG